MLTNYPELIPLICFGGPFIIGAIIFILLLHTPWFKKQKANAPKIREQRAKEREERLKNELASFHPHCIRCGYPLLHNETTCPKCGIQIQISPEELGKQQRIYLANNNAWGKTANGLQSASNSLNKTGSDMSRIGCMLTIFITIPILIILYFI